MVSNNVSYCIGLTWEFTFYRGDYQRFFIALRSILYSFLSFKTIYHLFLRFALCLNAITSLITINNIKIISIKSELK